MRNPHGTLTLTKIDKQTGNQNRIDYTSHHGDASLNGTICRLYAKDNIYNRSGSKKYFSKDEAIADFKFDSYGVPNITILSSTDAEIQVKNNKLEGLPMRNILRKRRV